MTTLLNKTILSKISAENQEDELKQLTENYPFFALAKYMLLRNTKEGSEKWLDQSKNAGLLFSSYLLGKNIENNHIELPIEASATVENILPENENKVKHSDHTENYGEQKLEPEINQGKEVEEPAIKNESPVPDTVTPVRTVHHVPSSPMLFIPLHTSDYFASQGIKISYDANPTDKLGKQLKSFTGWLQTMKQVHPTKINLATAQHDMKVEALAEKSNREDEVLTEAMAEAYQHQGKTGKAIETYQKLSLLNPAKSPYFAAKINELQR